MKEVGFPHFEGLAISNPPAKITGGFTRREEKEIPSTGKIKIHRWRGRGWAGSGPRVVE